MASIVYRNRMFSERILSTPAIFKETFKLFGCSNDKKLIWFFQHFFLTFLDFYFRCKFSFHEKPFESSLTEAWFFLTNHNSLLCIATSKVASFCIDNRLRQIAFASNWERFWNKKLKLYVFLLYKSIWSYRLVCRFCVLTSFWRHLWSITEQTYGNMEFIYGN